jgi:hypothetical protein
MIIFGLKNRVANEWRDKQELDHTNSDGSFAEANRAAVMAALAAKHDAE